MAATATQPAAAQTPPPPAAAAATGADVVDQLAQVVDQMSLGEQNFVYFEDGNMLPRSRQKFHVVSVGRTIGVFGDYDIVQKQTSKFNDACHKSYKSRDDAWAAWGDTWRSKAENPTAERIPVHDKSLVVEVRFRNDLHPGPRDVRFVDGKPACPTNLRLDAAFYIVSIGPKRGVFPHTGWATARALQRNVGGNNPQKYNTGDEAWDAWVKICRAAAEADEPFTVHPRSLVEKVLFPGPAI